MRESVSWNWHRGWASHAIPCSRGSGDSNRVATQAFIGLEVQQGRLSSIIGALTEMPQVLEIHATTGREDLLVRVATGTQAGLQQLIERIVLIPGVVHSTTTLALTTPLPYRAVPLLKDMARDAGWGRSTPTVKE